LKIVNDNYGHRTGDDYLREVVTLLRRHLRKSDSISRFGGDEFLVILPDCGEEEAQSIFSRMEEDLQSMNRRGRTYPLSFSYGLVQAEAGDEEDISSLIALADERMYLQKESKRKKRGGI
ncbi:MAG TPA: GGDEF domain-containing protein, partial [Sediminispirochaeta sp.]|nr:GGDEF domain-containing protein [Sediminispirochaeta sp.]